MPVALGCITTLWQALEYISAEAAVMESVCPFEREAALEAHAIIQQQAFDEGAAESVVAVEAAKSMILAYQNRCRAAQGKSQRGASALQCGGAASKPPGQVTSSDEEMGPPNPYTGGAGSGGGGWLIFALIGLGLGYVLLKKGR